MQNTLQQQLDISKSLLEALDRMVYSFETLTGQATSQSNIVSSLGDSMKKSEKLMNQASSKSSEISRDMERSNAQGAVKDIKKSAKNVSSIIDNSLEKTEKTFGNTISKALNNNRIIASLDKKTKAINSKLKNSTSAITKSLKRKILGMKSIGFIIKASRYAVTFLQKARYILYIYKFHNSFFFIISNFNDNNGLQNKIKPKQTHLLPKNKKIIFKFNDNLYLTRNL